MTATPPRYRDFNSYLRGTFGCRVQKITVDAGFTCPNRDGTISRGGCIYCNARGSGTGAYAEGLSVSEQLVLGKRHMSRRYNARKFIAYFQSFSNTYAPLETLEKVYREALDVPDVVGLSIGTRPDCVDEPVLDLLQAIAAARLVWVEYGLQSADDRTLADINRGHDAACFQRAVRATQGRGIRICAHVILGLPGEDRSHVRRTAEFISDLGIEGVKIHLLYVVRGTPLESRLRQGRYQCLSREAYAELVCDFLERIPGETVIQRLTGDPHPHELVAPRWSLDKREALAQIHRRLEERQTWQGRLAVNRNS